MQSKTVFKGVFKPICVLSLRSWCKFLITVEKRLCQIEMYVKKKEEFSDINTTFNASKEYGNDLAI